MPRPRRRRSNSKRLATQPGILVPVDKLSSENSTTQMEMAQGALTIARTVARQATAQSGRLGYLSEALKTIESRLFDPEFLQTLDDRDYLLKLHQQALKASQLATDFVMEVFALVSDQAKFNTLLCLVQDKVDREDGVVKGGAEVLLGAKKVSRKVGGMVLQELFRRTGKGNVPPSLKSLVSDLVEDDGGDGRLSPVGGGTVDDDTG